MVPGGLDTRIDSGKRPGSHEYESDTGMTQRHYFQKQFLCYPEEKNPGKPTHFLTNSHKPHPKFSSFRMAQNSVVYNGVTPRLCRI